MFDYYDSMVPFARPAEVAESPYVVDEPAAGEDRESAC